MKKLNFTDSRLTISPSTPSRLANSWHYCLPILAGSLFFLLNLSGDHVFNKTNTLKMVLLAISCTVLFFAILFLQKIKHLDWKVLVFLFLPIIATFPGWLLSGGRYDYGLPYEFTSQTLCCLWAFCVYSGLNSKKDIHIFFGFILASTLFVCIIAVIEKVGLNPLIRFRLNPFEDRWIGHQLIYTGPVPRVESTFGNINYFAAYLVLIIPVLTSILLSPTSKKVGRSYYPVICLFTVFIAIASLVLTETRAAFAAFILSSILFFGGYYFWFNRSYKLLLMSFLAVALVLFSIATSHSTLVDRIVDLSHSNAWLARIISWEVAWNSIVEQPLFGYGIGSSYELFFNFPSPDRSLDRALFAPDMSFNHVHSEWLEVLQEGGLFGFGLYLLFWTVLFFIALGFIKNQHEERRLRLLVLGLVSGLLAYQTHGFFSVAPRMIIVRFVAYSLIAVVLLISLQHSKQPPFIKQWLLPNTATRKPVVFTIFVAIMAVWFWLVPYSQTHFLLTNGIAKEKTHPEILYKLAETSADVYVLDKASNMAFENSEALRLHQLAKASSDIFPMYRNSVTNLAYANLLKGKYGKAIDQVKIIQSTDLYQTKAMTLLTHASLVMQNQVLFQEQVGLAVKLYLCATQTLECQHQTINTSIGKMARPIQFLENENALSVYIDESFVQYLHTESVSRNTDIATVQKRGADMANAIGNSAYFLPTTLMEHNQRAKQVQNYLKLIAEIASLTASKQLAIELPSDINLLKNIRAYQHRVDEIDKQIELLEAKRSTQLEQIKQYMDLDQFIQRRDFLLKFTSWLVSSVYLASMKE